MVLSTRNKAARFQGELSVAEVYNLWELLTANYRALENLKFYLSYAHDLDLKYRLEDTISDIEKRTENIIKQMKAYNLRTPNSPKKNFSAVVNPQNVDDELIGGYLLLMAQERLELKLRAVRNALFNDDIRKLFMNLVKGDIENIDSIVKYLKLKGWIEQPPLFPNVPSENKEKIDIGETYHLWDHLTYRYINIEQTKLFYKIAHDGDFKFLLKKGEDTLKKQAAEIEKEMEKFGLPFPKMPRENAGVIENTEMVNDDYLFNVLLNGMQAAGIIHTHALKKPTNDRLRKLFGKLLWEETKIIDSMMKYGKIKGWIVSPPLYQT